MDGNLKSDNEDPSSDSSAAHQPRKGSKSWVLILLGLVSLIVGGVLIANQMLDKPMLDFQNSNVDLALTSPEVESALGSPVSPGKVDIESNGDAKRTFTVQLKGSKAEGKLVFDGTLAGKEWTRDSIYLEANGQKTDLDPEAIFDLDIDMGQ